MKWTELEELAKRNGWSVGTKNASWGWGHAVRWQLRGVGSVMESRDTYKDEAAAKRALCRAVQALREAR